MLRHPALLTLMVLLPLAGASGAWPQPPEAPLQNSDVIALVAAGLGKDVILARIEAAARARFDLSTPGLIELKKQGVSDSIIAAMLKRAAAVERAETLVPRAATAPVELRTADGSFALAGLFGTCDTDWTRKITWRGGQVQRFAGERALVRTRDPRPTLGLKSDADPRFQCFFVHLQVDRAERVRRLPIGSGFLGGKGPNQPDDGSTLAYEAAQESPGLWRLIPEEPLPPGEYGVYVVRAATAGGQLFAFGVDN